MQTQPGTKKCFLKGIAKCYKAFQVLKDDFGFSCNALSCTMLLCISRICCLFIFIQGHNGKQNNFEVWCNYIRNVHIGSLTYLMFLMNRYQNYNFYVIIHGSVFLSMTKNIV